ncbi:helix-turn-helix domain-containing protein [Scandinavium goeteborgense]|uniref:helix-turn-helix domain-containing protein n=1 Tax=Scandinavium goeteborgense TaxID=1851514 RepID=UPI002165C7D4|nr:helix-turn-helix domain-containing protein [Scandinavium goeteborgense]MCS2154742.1 helix-turn-helix domain-containing protein [Scandinavium goeteborgense]
MNMNEQIASRLKAAREKKGISQKVLADRCGWAQSRVGNYESGARAIGLDDAVSMARELGISPVELVFGEEGQDLRRLNEKQAHMLDLFNQLPDKEQDNMMQVFSKVLRDYDGLIDTYLLRRDKSKDI